MCDVRLGELDDRGWSAIHDAFLEHAVLVFPEQFLSEEEQVAFGRRFGRIEHIVGDLDIVSISNQRADGSLLPDDAPSMQILRGNEGWHTDSSYMPLAAKASILSAHVVPSSGGATEWADMRAAWNELDESMRERVAQLRAFHSLRHSQTKIGDTGPPGIAYGFGGGDPPLRPLCKIHPETGRPALFIGRHAFGIPGLAPAESEALLDRLLADACQEPRTLLHEWAPGDVVVWDNRCVLHRARPFDHSQPRVMKHVRVSGDPNSERAPTGTPGTA